MLLIFVGFHFKGRVLLWFVFLFSVLAILLEVVFLIVWAILGPEWELADAWWMKLIGLMKLKSWRSPLVIYLLVLQLLAAGVALFEINGNRFRLGQLQDPRWEHFLSVLEHIGIIPGISNHLKPHTTSDLPLDTVVECDFHFQLNALLPCF
uniref:Uncharacterized protein n=1 Tax=Solanum tuberosum TaxID=4113 RepID=M0ZWV2_SOLTU